MKRISLLLALLLLCACGKPAADSTKVKAHFEGLSGFRTALTVTVNRPQAVQQFSLDYQYQRDGNDSFALAAPEGLSGIAGTIAGDSTADFSLQYEDLQLAHLLPALPGLSPADALFCLLADLRSGAPTECWRERTGGQDLLVLRYQSDERISRQVWLDANSLAPRMAEIYDNSKCVMTLSLSDYVQQ